MRGPGECDGLGRVGTSGLRCPQGTGILQGRGPWLTPWHLVASPCCPPILSPIVPAMSSMCFGGASVYPQRTPERVPCHPQHDGRALPPCGAVAQPVLVHMQHARPHPPAIPPRWPPRPHGTHEVASPTTPTQHHTTGEEFLRGLKPSRQHRDAGMPRCTLGGGQGCARDQGPARLSVLGRALVRPRVLQVLAGGGLYLTPGV